MISIRRRLTFMIMGTLSICILLIAVFSFFFVRSETYEVLDGELRQMAISIAPFDQKVEDFEGSDEDRLIEESDFLIQIWKDGALIYSSHPKIKMPLLDRGYGYFDWKDEELRYFQHHYKGRYIQIAQSLDERQDLEVTVFQNFMFIIVLMLPVILLLVHFIIGRGLRPLVLLSQRVKERNANNLTAIDISHAPAEILPVIQSLNQLLEKLENSLLLQRQFTADAAHEIRTPLSAIKLNLDMLCRTEDELERKSIEQSLAAGVNRTIHLAQNLLQLARHESEAHALDLEPVNLSHIAQQVINDHKAVAAEKKQQIQFEDDTVKEPIIEAQSHNIAIMIGSLLENALLYTPAQGKVEVCIQAKEDNILLSIADTGPGIKMEERERIFDRFYRGQDVKEQGSGLGLSIVKKIVDHYQGHISIQERREGEGSQFVIRFPASQNLN